MIHPDLSPRDPGIAGPSPRRLVLHALATAGTVVVLIGLTVALFFNPLWIAFEQDRAGVPTITGWTPEQVRAVTGSILADLVVGPPEFDVAVDGEAVLDAAERSHMVDVRNVLLPFGTLVAIATLALGTILVANRHAAWPWRAIARGSAVLAGIEIVVSLAVLLFFDAAFLLFHRVFFPQGNFSFDPRTERLTQLFPDQFWNDTSIAIGVVGLVIAVAATLASRRRAARMTD